MTGIFKKGGGLGNRDRYAHKKDNVEAHGKGGQVTGAIYLKAQECQGLSANTGS